MDASDPRWTYSATSSTIWRLAQPAGPNRRDENMAIHIEREKPAANNTCDMDGNYMLEELQKSCRQITMPSGSLCAARRSVPYWCRAGAGPTAPGVPVVRMTQIQAVVGPI